ncbi:unnamed protein product, partial [Brenthis ino]
MSRGAFAHELLQEMQTSEEKLREYRIFRRYSREYAPYLGTEFNKLRAAAAGLNRGRRIYATQYAYRCRRAQHPFNKPPMGTK